MSVDQFESFSLAGQIRDLEEQRDLVIALSSGQGKQSTHALNTINTRINLLRRGDLSEEAVMDAQLDSILGRSIGPVSDAGLASLGIAPME